MMHKLAHSYWIFLELATACHSSLEYELCNKISLDCLKSSLLDWFASRCSCMDFISQISVFLRKIIPLNIHIWEMLWCSQLAEISFHLPALTQIGGELKVIEGSLASPPFPQGTRLCLAAKANCLRTLYLIFFLAEVGKDFKRKSPVSKNDLRTFFNRISTKLGLHSLALNRLSCI